MWDPLSLQAQPFKFSANPLVGLNVVAAAVEAIVAAGLLEVVVVVVRDVVVGLQYCNTGGA